MRISGMRGRSLWLPRWSVSQVSWLDSSSPVVNVYDRLTRESQIRPREQPPDDVLVMRRRLSVQPHNPKVVLPATAP
jgi:hypothetical protein